MARMRIWAAWAAALLALDLGCTSVNKRLNKPDVHVEDRKPNETRATTKPSVDDGDDDGIFVGVAISGGGSRSANFSAACMFELERLRIMQHVDCISSVSGGSITGAYYCISDQNEWNPAAAQRKLTHSFANDILFRTLMPWNLLVLMASDWDRSDLLADSFTRVLFSRDGHTLTFKDLRPDRPRLLINATDLQSGKPFIFCDEAFDQLNSDLGAYPLGHAVAASAAVPVLLHQVTLRDYSTIFKQYRHLVDGGVVDNLGVKALVETYRAQVRMGGDRAYPRGAIFIVIDANTQFDARISNRGDMSILETLQFGAGLASTVLISRASSATLAEIILDSSPDSVNAGTLRRQRDALANDGYVRLENVDARPVYVLHLALSRVHDLHDLPFHGFTESVNSIATYFNIKGTEAHQLYQAAELLTRKRFDASLAAIAGELNGPTTKPSSTSPK